MLLSYLGIWPVIRFIQLYVGLFVDSIKIFMERVEEGIKELLRVVLAVALKHSVLFSDGVL